MNEVYIVLKKRVIYHHAQGADDEELINEFTDDSHVFSELQVAEYYLSQKDTPLDWRIIYKELK